MLTDRLMMIGHKRGTPMAAWRRILSKVPCQPLCRMIVFLGGIVWIKKERPQADIYKKYLGPDWKPKYTGASTLLFNHTSWFVCSLKMTFQDILLGMWWDMPSFLS